MNLAYLLLLLVAVGGWMLVQGRKQIGKMAQQAAAWVLIFVGVLAAIGLWDDIRGTISPRQVVLSAGQIEVPQDRSGHYRITADVNGVATRFIVDTGATDIVLSKEDARAAGIDPDTLVYSSRAQSANGVMALAPVMLDKITLGPVQFTRMRALVADSDLGQSLLGMSYLQHFTKIEISDRALILTP